MSLVPSEDKWNWNFGKWWSRIKTPTHHGTRRHQGHHHSLEHTFPNSETDRQLVDMEREKCRTCHRLGSPRASSGVSHFGLFNPYIERETEGKDTEPGKYAMNVHLGNYIEPGDVKVSAKDHTMKIVAKKEYKSDDGSCRMYQEYMRKFTLPENINMTEVKSILTPEGDLHIEAPLPQQALPEPRHPHGVRFKKA